MAFSDVPLDRMSAQALLFEQVDRTAARLSLSILRPRPDRIGTGIAENLAIRHCGVAHSARTTRPLPAFGTAGRHTRLVRTVFLLEAPQLVFELELLDLPAKVQQLALKLLLLGRRMGARLLLGRFLRAHARHPRIEPARHLRFRAARLEEAIAVGAPPVLAP